MQLNFTQLDLPEFKNLDEAKKYLFKLVTQLNQQAYLITELLNGRQTFGDGIDKDNISGKWIEFQTTGDEQSLTHNLGVIPVGFLVIYPPMYSFIDRGAAAWTTSTISVICGEIDETVRIFVLPPPVRDL